MISLILGLATFFVLLFLISYYDYQTYEVKKKLSRLLIRPDPEVYNKFEIFRSLGTLYDKVDNMLKAADLKISTDHFILAYLYFFVFCFSVAVIFDQLTYFVLLIILTIVVSKIALDYIASTRMFKFEEHFGRFAQDIAVMLRGTPNLIAVLEDVAIEETNPRLKREIENILNEVNAGTSIDSALKKFKERNSYSNIVATWVDSIIFANLTGSSLSDVCMTAARKINDKLFRARLIRQKTARLKSVMLATIGLTAVTLGFILFLFPEAKEAYSAFTGKLILVFVLSIIIGSTYYMLKTIDKIAKG